MGSGSGMTVVDEAQFNPNWTTDCPVCKGKRGMDRFGLSPSSWLDTSTRHICFVCRGFGKVAGVRKNPCKDCEGKGGINTNKYFTVNTNTASDALEFEHIQLCPTC